MAIGATSRDVIRMVLASALGLVVAGLIIGVPIALWTKGYAASVLAVDRGDSGRGAGDAARGHHGPQSSSPWSRC